MKRVLTAVAVMLSAAVPVLAGNGTIERKERSIPNQYMVVLDDSKNPKVPDVATSFVKAHGVKILSVWEHAVRGFAVQATPEAAAAIARHPLVQSIEEDGEGGSPAHCWFDHQTYPSRCADGALPWQLDRVDQRDLPMNGVYEGCTLNKGAGVRVYIIDSGIRNHRDFTLPDETSRLLPGVTFVNDGNGTDDCFSHGTYVAGFAVGRWSGIAKEAWVIPVRIANCTGGVASQSVYVNAINWITQDHTSGPAVANLSYTPGSSSTIDTAANNMINDGVVFVTGAGNTGGNNCNSSPQRVANVLNVGATTNTDAKASFSSTGSCVGIFAPGVGVGGPHFAQYDYFNCNPGWNGTSVAAPLVAGAAAVAYAQYYWYTAPQIRQEVINRSTLNKVSGLPSGTPNRLLYSATPDWCPWMSCDGPPPDM